MIDYLLIPFIVMLAFALGCLWPRDRAPVGWCSWCERVIFEPFAQHYDRCNPFNEHVSLTIVRARAAYRERLIRTKCDGQRIEVDRDGVRMYDSMGKLIPDK
jgi:hypothetical protein